MNRLRLLNFPVDTEYLENKFILIDALNRKKSIMDRETRREYDIKGHFISDYDDNCILVKYKGNKPFTYELQFVVYQ